MRPLSTVEKAVEFARKHSTLSWYDYMYYRVMERFKGVNELSIEAGDMEDLLKKSEYLDIKDYIEEVRSKEDEQKAKQEQAASKARNRR